ncbi:hypothetical protein HMF3257_34130 [Spirosoma telluris]|uniref:Uncharacterized protein n=1 Tax=Spirosoma telluris TaxID=2183553 RepID=A0A327NRL8_9BACT|nr:hypothetical protein HMF3257_34130 [Spirosoma telluris]
MLPTFCCKKREEYGLIDMRQLLYLTAFMAAYWAGWFVALTFFRSLYQKQFFDTGMDSFKWFIDGF